MLLTAENGRRSVTGVSPEDLREQRKMVVLPPSRNAKQVVSGKFATLGTKPPPVAGSVVVGRLCAITFIMLPVA